jgi:predicted anti-sigma-YlaC factor YlaD
MTWLPNTLPPHTILALQHPEIQQSLEKLIDAHLELCAECREWKAEHINISWRGWIVERHVV